MSRNAKTCNAKLPKVGFKFNLNVMTLNHCILTKIKMQIANAQSAHPKYIETQQKITTQKQTSYVEVRSGENKKADCRYDKPTEAHTKLNQNLMTTQLRMSHANQQDSNRMLTLNAIIANGNDKIKQPQCE